MKTLTISLFCCGALSILAGCGGSGGQSFSATSVHSAPTAPAGNVTYSAPLAVPGTAGAQIINVSPNGQMIGANSSNAPIYWASPQTAPVSINVTGTIAAIVLGINNSGQMVGYDTVAGAFVPLYWSSAAAAPVAMSLLAGHPSEGAATINASGQIVGSTGSGNTSEALYWASPTSTPTALAGTSGGVGQGYTAVRISDTGIIIGVGLTAPAVVWSSPTANARALNIPNGDQISGGGGLLGFAFNQQTGDTGQTVAVGILDHAFVWPASNFAFNLLPVPNGYTGSTLIQNLGGNHEAVGVSDSTVLSAVIWPTLTSPFEDLNTLIPAGTNWTLETADFMTSAGVVIGRGTDPTNQLNVYVVTPNP